MKKKSTPTKRQIFFFYFFFLLQSKETLQNRMFMIPTLTTFYHLKCIQISKPTLR